MLSGTGNCDGTSAIGGIGRWRADCHGRHFLSARMPGRNWVGERKRNGMEVWMAAMPGGARERQMKPMMAFPNRSYYHHYHLMMLTAVVVIVGHSPCVQTVQWPP